MKLRLFSVIVVFAAFTIYTATVVMNHSDLEIPYNFIVSGREIKLASPPHSIQTLVW